MLKHFEVTNFKNFNKKFTFDLSDTKNYAFNENCIDNNIVNTGIIYGPNGCGKSNLGHAIFDLATHLTDEKISATYLKDYLNAENESEIAEFKYQFQFGDHIVEYSYGKFNVNKFAYEIVKIDDREIISYERGKKQLPIILLKGTENLNKNLSDDSISIVKYISSNSVLSNGLENIIFYYFTEFVNYMRLIQPIGKHNYIGRDPNANWLEYIINDEKGYTLEAFEEFINSAGIKCKLAISKNIEEDRLTFNFGRKKIDFMNNASSGTQVLTGLYLELILLRLGISNAENDSENKITSLGNIEPSLTYKPFIFVDEFDAYYNHTLSELVVKEIRELNAQAILTTHNTSIMTNELLRPDCYFKMNSSVINPLHKNTEKELRKAHSLEKMYRAGSFNE